MGFETLRLEDVQQGTTPQAAPLPIGKYTMRLLAAKPNDFQEGGLAFDMVVDDGPYARRRVFPTLPPPPDKSHWSAQAAAKFLSTLGVEQAPGETVLEAFNRAASNGHSKFNIQTKQFTKNNGEVKPDVNWFSVEAYAG